MSDPSSKSNSPAGGASGSFVSAVLKRAISQDGVRENRDASGHANNTGRMVEMFQRSVGIPPGSAWCAAFVFWAISEEAKARQIEPPFLRSGYCPAIHSWSNAAGLSRSTPEVGDAFLRLLNYPEGRFASHIGLVTAVNGSTFESIEGNTNAGLSNEGDGVYRRTRPVNSDYVFVRWPRLLPKPVTDPPTFTLIVNGKKVCAMPVIEGRSYCPIRAWADHWDLDLEWDSEAQAVILDGVHVPPPVHLDKGVSYAPLNNLIAGTKLKASVDSAARTVTLSGGLK